MKKYILFTLTLLLFFCSAMAQQISKQVYAISYIEEHHLMQKMNQLTVVNVKLEWPDRLCGSDVPLLKKKLCSLLFDNESTSYRESLNALLTKCGKELKAMPTSKGMKTTYMSFQIVEVAYQPDKYISFEVIKTVRNEDNLKPFINDTYLLTYDLVNDKVLRTKDILKPQFHREGYGRFYMIDEILNADVIDVLLNADQQEYNYLIDNMPDETCLTPDGLVFNIPESSSDDEGDLLVVVPKRKSMDYYRNGVNRWLKNSKVKSRTANAEESVAVPIIEEEMVDTTNVYDAAPIMPQYEGGTKTMMQDLVRWVEYPEYEMDKHIEGKVVVSFVVGRDGRVSLPTVITPLSPGIDRAAVKAVMALSKWTPGAFGSTKVNVRMAVPVIFKLSI